MPGPQIVARQAPLSMGFPRQEYWRGLPFPSPGDLPNPGIEPKSPVSHALAGKFFLCCLNFWKFEIRSHQLVTGGEGNGTPLQYSCLENPMDGGAWKAALHGVTEGRKWLSNFPFTFHFHALEKEMATHYSVLAWRIPGMGEPGGLPSMGSHRVGHDWNDLAVERGIDEKAVIL